MKIWKILNKYRTSWFLMPVWCICILFYLIFVFGWTNLNGYTKYDLFWLWGLIITGIFLWQCLWESIINTWLIFLLSLFSMLFCSFCPLFTLSTINSAVACCHAVFQCFYLCGPQAESVLWPLVALTVPLSRTHTLCISTSTAGTSHSNSWQNQP